MNQILEHLDDAQRPLKEGFNLYKSNHVVSVGRLKNAKDVLQINAGVIQTSQPKSAPHTVNLWLKSKVSEWITKCSCKAGLGGKCKHIFAVLLLLHNTTEPLEELSCTDVQQKWGHSTAEKNNHLFDAKKFRDLCCFAIATDGDELPSDINDSNFKRLVHGNYW